MVRSLLLMPLGFLAVSAFVGTPLVSRTIQTGAPLYMGGSTGYATTREGKEKRVAWVKELVEKSEMIVTVPAGSMTVAQSESLRNSMPEGTTVSVIKNTLMRRAVEGTEFESAVSVCKGPNMWFFIEEDIGGSIKAFNDFAKENGKTESHPFKGGVLEGKLYDQAGVDSIGKLPSKKELYAKIAMSIKAIPTKLARVIKAPSVKLARAIKLATLPEEDGN